MLIINADDYGFNERCTDRILDCYLNGRITSTSAMVFMRDSIRAAETARMHGLHVGLHLNFTNALENTAGYPDLSSHQNRIIDFFAKNRFTRMLYNPAIKKSLSYSFKSQYDEFLNRYLKPPTHIDGHHHIHLCTNMLIDPLYPNGIKLRPSLHCEEGRLTIFKNLYRTLIDRVIRNRYKSVESLFKLDLHSIDALLPDIVDSSMSSDIELMTHPGIRKEYEYLKSDRYEGMISQGRLGSYASL